MPEPRPLRVFLCHASNDKPIVRELYQKLRAEDWIQPWLDEEKLSLGQHWATGIEEALDSSDIVIIFLSKNSVQKEGFIQRELNYAWELSLEKPRHVIFLIPFRLDDCEVPRYLRSRQWGDYFGGKKEATYQNLVQSLKRRHEQKSRLEAEERARDEIERKPAPKKESKPVEEKKPIFEKSPRPKVATSPSIKPAAPISDKLTLSNGMEFMRVPTGTFLMGSKDNNKLADGDERPQHTVDLPYEYWMARFPVTNEAYNAYVEAKGIKHSVDGWERKKDHPVVYVEWNHAMEYCQWLNNLLKGELPSGLVLRLPTEAEWEKAARGVEANEWPWGNEFDKNKCNSSEGGKGGTTPVGAYSPRGDSPYGCADMVGNVWEWTHSVFKPYPYQSDDGREDKNASARRALRGGSFNDDRRRARCAVRDGDFLDFSSSLGFRVCASPNLS